MPNLDCYKLWKCRKGNTVLESDAELTQQEIDEIIEICEIVQQWALDIEDYVFG